MGYEVLEGKNCFITGATGGIGRTLAIKMAERKCNLFLTSTNATQLKQLKKEIKHSSNRDIDIYYSTGDLSKITDIKRVLDAAKKYFGSIDILINSAGILIVKSLTNSTWHDFNACFNINVRAAFMITKELTGAMIKNKWGRIVNIGSSSAYSGYRNTSIYCAAKHAILGFSRATHDELKKHGIRTFCISPSAVKTNMGKMIEKQNYNTFLDADEVAEYIIFACSFDKDMISDEIQLHRMITQ